MTIIKFHNVNYITGSSFTGSFTYYFLILINPIKTISVAEEFAQAISAVYHEEPVSTLVGGDFAL